MNDEPTAAATLTDEQLADIVRFIARTCLEVERGLRPPHHLLRLMDPPTALRWRRQELIGRFDGGPVQRQDIGLPRLSRLSHDHVIGTITTRTQGDRWGALTLRLRSDDRRWRLAEVQRLLAAGHYRTSLTNMGSMELPLKDRLARANVERRLVDAALRATSRRLADLPSTDPGRRSIGQLVSAWRRIGGEIDQELADLRTRLLARQTVKQAGRRVTG